MSRRRAYWLCQIIGWTIYQSVGLAFVAAFTTVDSRAVISYLGTIVTAIGASHSHRWAIRRYGWLALDMIPRTLRLLVSTAFTGILAAAGALSVGFGIAGYRTLEPQIAPFIMSWIVANLFWTVLYVAIHDVEKSRRTEREKLELQIAAKDAELRALLAQVNPHFLFNWLNNLRGMILEDPLKAQDIVTRFADLMRYSLQSGQQREVPLGDEITAVENYLACEKVRLEERLQIEVNVSPALRVERVPPMIVQTLVENGVKHGVSQLPEGGLVRISALADSNQLLIEVANTGRWIAPNGKGTHTGIAHTRARLSLLYGEGYSSLDISDKDGFVVAQLSIPRRKGHAE
jgi:sensor histidine kinase YesM